MPIPRCEIDESIKRPRVGDFSFALGVNPLDPIEPRPGFTVTFEQGSGDGPEEWPDRYVYDVLITAERMRSLVRTAMILLPGRVYPIMDVLGYDAYREVDPYIAYDLIGLDRFQEGVWRFSDFLFEDGMVGFGALSDDPFYQVMVDEHKVVTIRCGIELRETVEAMLAAFDLTELPEIRSADTVQHEHRSVLLAPTDRPDLLLSDEVVEDLIDGWGLVLNVDPDANVDEEGEDLGITGWRCVVRSESMNPPPNLPDPAESEASQKPKSVRFARYIEVLVTASCLREADEIALDAASRLIEQHQLDAPPPPGTQLALPPGPTTNPKSDPPAEEPEIPNPDKPRANEEVVVSSDRLAPEDFGEAVGSKEGKAPDFDEPKCWHVSWME